MISWKDSWPLIVEIGKSVTDYLLDKNISQLQLMQEMEINSVSEGTSLLSFCLIPSWHVSNRMEDSLFWIGRQSYNVSHREKSCKSAHQSSVSHKSSRLVLMLVWPVVNETDSWQHTIYFIFSQSVCFILYTPLLYLVFLCPKTELLKNSQV